MNIFVSVMIAVSLVAAFSPQQSKKILENDLIKNARASVEGHFFFVRRTSTITSIKPITVTSTTATYSTCYCSVSPLTACPTNRKKKQIPWFLSQPYVVEPLPFQSPGNQPLFADDFSPYPWAPSYNLTNHRTAIEKYPHSPLRPQWPLSLISFEQVVPVEDKRQENQKGYDQNFLISNPTRPRPELKKRPEESAFLNDEDVYSGPTVESSMSREAGGSEGRIFNNYVVLLSTFTVTSYVSTLAGTQQLAVACLPAGANFPGPTCTNTCPKLILDLCQGLGNAFCTSSGKGVCDSRTGLCTCDAGFTLDANGKCVVCTGVGDCVGKDPAKADSCDAGKCTCSPDFKNDPATGKCVVCTGVGDCVGKDPAKADTCDAGKCTCSPNFKNDPATGKCVVCTEVDHCVGAALATPDSCVAGECTCTADFKTDPATGKCVVCIKAADCGAAPGDMCTDGTCSCETGDPDTTTGLCAS